MEVKRLYEAVGGDQKGGSLEEKAYWEDLWECYIGERSMDYASLNAEEATPRLASRQNLRERRHAGDCGKLGVDIRVGGVCYIDFDEAYVSKIGYQHFGLIITIFHDKAFAVPMNENHTTYLQAYSKGNPERKRRLMRLGKIKGMDKESVLLINDAKWINTARIIDIRTHLRRDSELFREIEGRVKDRLD